MRNYFILTLILFYVSSCSVMNVNRESSYDLTNFKIFKKLTNKLIVIYPNRTFESESVETLYGDKISIPLDFRNCSIEIYHEITYYQSELRHTVMDALFVASLGIIPYNYELSFKTKLTVSNGINVEIREVTSDKFDVSYGIFYIPAFTIKLFDKNLKVTNNITAKMYEIQVASLAKELKGFNCSP